MDPVAVLKGLEGETIETVNISMVDGSICEVELITTRGDTVAISPTIYNYGRQNLEIR